MKSSAMKKSISKPVSKPTPKSSNRGLGKGLSALMSESYSHIDRDETPEVKEMDTGSSKQASLPLSSIQPGKYQPREHFDNAALSELADSIRKNGVMQPIMVRSIAQDKYEIVAGERRWRAAKIAGLTEIPVVLWELGDEQALEIALVENIQRRDLSPLEEASGYQRLMDDFGYTQENLASTVHKSRSHIANLLRLLSLPDDIRQFLAEDKLTMGHARALMGVENASEIAEQVIARNLNVRQTEKLARLNKEPGKERKPRQKKAEMFSIAPQPANYNGQKDPDILALEETLSENLGLKVSINDRGQSGEIMIAYESLEQLDEILRRLGGGA